MLIDLDPLLTPDLLWVLAAMGHGDDLAFVDSNFPAETIARRTTSGRLIRLPAMSMARAARAIFSVLPIDTFVPDPVRRIEVVGKPDEVLPIHAEVLAELTARVPDATFGRIERFAFYDTAARGFAVVQVGDPRAYGCFMIKKGVIFGEPER
ncbi:fucose-binding protein [Siculibacillus lacustris]|uniref:Fucose-binding protein n=1 Tax=Siculibacillus lacustris TaxID=1549641 RepID=A0A4Q9VS00_9HYPH|nr:RbsD/FucU domain-containing protein [Siculibacillus lacustris]TBW38731.1 fucose-binding protein [Siculibacillus lacustris]